MARRSADHDKKDGEQIRMDFREKLRRTPLEPSLLKPMFQLSRKLRPKFRLSAICADGLISCAQNERGENERTIILRVTA
jgi:hypothetical protein